MKHNINKKREKERENEIGKENKKMEFILPLM